MAIRRLMMMGLANYIRSLINSFKTTVSANQGIFESEDCMYEDLDELNKLELLGNATYVYTPNSYGDGDTFYQTPSIGTTPIVNLLWNTGIFNTNTVSNNAVSYGPSTASTDPFGGTYSNLIAETTASSAHSITTRIFPYTRNAVAYTFSVYLKKGNGATAPDIMQLNFVGNGFPISSYANFNINTGTVIVAGSGVTPSITSVGGGWFRCSITVTPVAGNEATVATVCFTNNNGAVTRNPTYTGVVTNNVFAYGLQVEVGSSPTTYQDIAHPALINNVGAVVRLNQVATKLNSDKSVEFAGYNLLRDTNNLFLSWAATRASFSYSSQIAPDGTLTAHKLIEDTTVTSTHFFATSNIQLFKKGTTITFSIYAKAAERNWFYIQYFDGASSIPSVVNTFFDLTNGVIGNIGTGVTAAIENVGGGWYKCSVTRIKGIVATNIDGILFNIAMTTGNGQTSYTGDGTSGMIFWQPQLVTGSTKPVLPSILNFFPRLTYNDFDGYNDLTTCPNINLEISKAQNFNFSEDFNRGGNLLLQSQDWTQAIWAKGGATIVSSLRVAPDGTSTATELSDVGASGTPGVTQQTFTATSDVITYSIYTKAVSTSTRRFLLRNSTTSTNFDILDFNYSSTGNLGNGWFSEDVGNGWFKLSYTRNSGISIGNSLQAYYGRTNTAAVGATDVWQVWGAQAEPNERVTEYTRTTTATVLGTTTTNMTVTSGTISAPNPGYLADTLTATSSNAILRKNGVSSTTNGNVRFSIYLKRKTGIGNVTVSVGNVSSIVNINSIDWTRVYVAGNTITGTYSVSGTTLYTVNTSSPHGLLTGDSVRFDATSGTAADTTLAAITVTSSTQFTFIGTSATTSGNCNIYPFFGRVTLDSNGDEVYAWGSMLEFPDTGVTVPTSYMPTYSTSIVSRASESLHLNIPSASSKTVFVELKKAGSTNNSTVPLLFLSNNLGPTFATDSLIVSGLVGIFLTKRISQSTTIFANPLAYGFITNKYNKFAFVFNGTNVDIWIDGAYQTTTSFATSNLLRYLTVLGVGGIASVKSVFSWDTILNSSQLASLTYNPYFQNGTTELTQLIGRAFASSLARPSDSTLQALDTFIATLKASGTWDKMDAIYNFAYNDTNVAPFSRLNMKSSFYTLGVSGVMTYQSNGYLNSSSGVLTSYNPGVNNTQVQIDSFSMTFILYQGVSNAQITNNSINGANAAIFNGNVATHRVMSNTNLPQAVDLSGTGLKSMMRTSSTSVTLYNQSTGTTLTQSRSGAFGASQQTFPQSNGMGVGFACFGAPLTQTDVDTIRTAYNTYLSAIGLTPFA